MDKKLRELGITKKELDVFELYSQGLKQVQIALVMNMSKTGICRALERIEKKTGIKVRRKATGKILPYETWMDDLVQKKY